MFRRIISRHKYCICPRNIHSINEDSRYIQSIFRETDFWLRMSRLICDAGLFMFQSRSQWQFIWRTHKKAKYREISLISGNKWLTCYVSWCQYLLNAKFEAGDRSRVLCRHQAVCVLDNWQSPERGERLSRCQIGQRAASHVSRDPSRVIKSSEPSGDLSQLWSVTQTLSSCHQSLSLDVTRGIRQ